ncbi:hypothetical protein [Oryzihumus sp.]|uniref:hypothetical protein n=1 Tax=Oryzihumus sp. TaxID=1968903 RepID=UPI002EDA2C1A
MSEHPVPAPKQPGAPSRLRGGLPAGAPAPAIEDPAVTALLRAVTAPATDGELTGQVDAVAAFLAHVSRRPPTLRRHSRVAVPAIAAMVGVFALGETAAAAMTGSLPTPLQDFAHHLTGVPAPSRVIREVPTGPAGQHHPGASLGPGPVSIPAARPTDLPASTLPEPSARSTARDGATGDRGSVQSTTADPRATGSSQRRSDAQGNPTAQGSGSDTRSGHSARPSTQGDELGHARGTSGAAPTSPSGTTAAPQPAYRQDHPSPPRHPQGPTTTNTTPGHGRGR